MGNKYIGETTSDDELQVRHGVPQGSIIGSTLSLILLIDLTLGEKSLLFANDSTFWAKRRNLDLLQQEILGLLGDTSWWFAGTDVN